MLIFQTLIYTNNNQKISFKLFEWYSPELTLGKYISISFFSGLFISTLLNNTITTYKDKETTFKNIEENNANQNNDLNYEYLDNEEDMKSNVKMPPERDLRDSQPTISVNYRVIKSMDENNSKSSPNYSNKPDDKDDWDNQDNEW